MTEDALTVASLVKSGDVVLFAAPPRAPAWLGWLQRHSWAHIGLVVREPGDPEPMVWECRGQGPRRSSVVVRLAPRIAGAPGRVSVPARNACGWRRHRDPTRRENGSPR